MVLVLAELLEHCLGAEIQHLVQTHTDVVVHCQSQETMDETKPLMARQRATRVDQSGQRAIRRDASSDKGAHGYNELQQEHLKERATQPVP